MRTPVRLAVFVAVAFGAGWSVSSCGSSSGTATVDGGGSSGNANFFMCQQGTCSTAEIQPYNDCFASHCGTQVKTCFGAGALEGNFSGACGTFIACSRACGCDPSPTCLAACGLPTADCISCLPTLDDCRQSSGCQVPACASFTSTDAGLGGSPATGVDGGTTRPDANFGDILDALPPAYYDALAGFLDALGGTCADLANCCASMDAVSKVQCQTLYDQLKGTGDVACSFLLAGYRKDGKCQ